MFKANPLTSIWIAALASASIAGPQLASAQDDVAQIEAVWDAYEASAVASDVAARLALWDDEGIQMQPGIPARGKDAMAEVLPKRFEAVTTHSMTILPEETSWLVTRHIHEAPTPQTAKWTAKPSRSTASSSRLQTSGRWRLEELSGRIQLQQVSRAP